MSTRLTPEFLRQQIIGIDSSFKTPFGERLMVYCDYTASGRCLGFVEKYLQSLQRNYANTHTEDDITGRSMTRLLHQAESAIKKSVNAGPDGRIIAHGTGATGAIDKLQQILGISLPPASREKLNHCLDDFLGQAKADAFREHHRQHQPIVFVGPYEHHSNEISWRQGMATVVEVNLDASGGIDLQHLEKLLQDPRYLNRIRIGSFSAASNVSGRISPVHDIARMLHKHNAIAVFDYAASAPYVEINMSPPLDPDGGDPGLDAVFISPHKFLGGPGSSGILVFKQQLYRRDLPPTLAAGGTVDYVSPLDQDFIANIEEREKPGTPGVLQLIKAALTFQIKDEITPETIEEYEQKMLHQAFTRWMKHPQIEIMGNTDPEKRVGIVSFNIRSPKGRYLHPKLLTALLNDLFGIQSRAGCSCAGPYGHTLLGIDLKESEKHRHWVREGYGGIKPGWCRISFHYTMDAAETDYIIEAVEFLADHGYRFLSLYDFDLCTGAWQHKQQVELCDCLSVDCALNISQVEPFALPAATRIEYYRQNLDSAQQLAETLAAEQGDDCCNNQLEGDLAELQFFDY